VKRVYVPIEDAKLERLLEASEAAGFTVEQLVQRAVSEFLDGRRRKALIDQIDACMFFGICELRAVKSGFANQPTNG
jgi:hypothetical protein